VSPTRRRRTGDQTLEAAAEAATTAGTVYTDLSDAPASTPDEPAWLREPASTGEDPAVRVQAPDPKALKAALRAREEEKTHERACDRARAKTGKRIDARIAIMAMTTSSSMRVKPCLLVLVMKGASFAMAG